MTILIALIGPAGAGKSSVAKMLVDEYGATRYSLADPLKEMAKRVLDFTEEQVRGTQEQKETVDPRYGFSPRWFLQRLGVEGGRAVLGDGVWTHACLRKIDAEAPTVAVIDDARVVNEARLIQKRGGFVIRLEPPDDLESVKRRNAAGDHPSEHEWAIAPFNRVVKPTSRRLDELFALVRTAVEHARDAATRASLERDEP